MFFILLFLFSLSFFITNFLIPLFIKIAFKFNFLDNADGILKHQVNSIPYLGGIAVYIGFIITVILTIIFDDKFFLLFIGLTILLLVGLIDDIKPIKPYQKFIGQIVAALIFLKGDFYLKENLFLKFFNLEFPDFIVNGLNLFISFFWIIAIINAINLVDVMDGLSAALSISSSITFLFNSIFFENYNVTLFLASFLGSLIAFFRFNKPPAIIYLGDSGSLFIGGLLSTIPFMFNSFDVDNSSLFIPSIIILFIPLLEISTLILLRTIKGIPFYKGSDDHFCIYLKQKGWSKYEILFLIILFSFLLALLNFCFIYNLILLPTTIIILILLTIIWYILIFSKLFFYHFI